MTPVSVALIAVFLLIMLLLVKPLGLYMANVMEGRPNWALQLFGGFERLLYRLSGVDPATEMGWKRYMIALLLFNVIGALALYAIQRLQALAAAEPAAVRERRRRTRRSTPPSASSPTRTGRATAASRR